MDVENFGGSPSTSTSVALPVTASQTVDLLQPGYHHIPVNVQGDPHGEQFLFYFSDKFLIDHQLLAPDFYSASPRISYVTVITSLPSTTINQNTTVGHFISSQHCEVLEFNAMPAPAPLPPENEVTSLRRHVMTEEEFSTLDIATDLTPEQFSRLKSLIMKYRDIFYFNADDQGRYRLEYPEGFKVFPMKENIRPIRQRPYKLSIKERDILKAHCDDLVKRKIAKYSLSKWASPVMLIKRSCGTRWRLVVDY
jgi:hypothetical protein